MQVDSWSLAVEPNFLQTLHKDLIKQQDVIYGTATVTKHTHTTCGLVTPTGDLNLELIQLPDVWEFLPICSGELLSGLALGVSVLVPPKGV